jgi:hypothetical protein
MEAVKSFLNSCVVVKVGDFKKEAADAIADSPECHPS